MIQWRGLLLAPSIRYAIDAHLVLEREDKMPTHQTRFQGFPKETFSFLSDLSSNNRKTWFDANKTRFRRVVEQPVQDFLSVMCARFVSSPSLRQVE